MAKGNNSFEKFTNNGVVNFYQSNHSSNKNNGKASPRPKSLASQPPKDFKKIFYEITEALIFFILSLILCRTLFIFLLPEQIPFFFLTFKMVKVFISK